MPTIVFLLGDTRLARNDNHERLPRGFRDAGWTVTTASQDAVRLEPGGVRLGDADPAGFDLIWILGLGRAESFYDRMQLLAQLPRTQFVTGVDALWHLHAKYPWWRHMPETYASNDFGYLQAVLSRGGAWVAKPPAGSYGRDVVRVTDDGAGMDVIARLTAQGGYCLLQRYVPEIERGEKRTLVAGGRVIGSYLRRPVGDGFHANLATGATAEPAALTSGERALVDTLAADLAARGVGFAAIDVAYPYLMEVNLANPGGLATLAALTGADPTPQVVSALAAWRDRAAGGFGAASG